jgi:tight adherence protein C
MGLVIGAFLVFFALIASGGLLFFYRDVTIQRLGSVVSQRLSGPAKRRPDLRQRGTRAAVETIVMPFQNILPRNPKDVSLAQKRLICGGYREDVHLNIFFGSKALVPLLLVIITTFLNTAYLDGNFTWYLVAAGIGFLVPDIWLRRRTAKRRLQIRLGLPEALDLMVVCIEAGLGIDQAILRTSTELNKSQPEISDELGMVVLEQRAGRPRDEAWKNLAERTNVDTVRALVATMIQADHFGTSVSKSLRSYSDTLRTQRRQQVEEAAAKTTVKLVFPLVLFIFPSIFVVTLGPAVITIMDFFSKAFGK